MRELALRIALLAWAAIPVIPICAREASAEVRMTAPADSAFALSSDDGSLSLRALRVRFGDVVSRADYDTSTQLLVVELQTAVETRSSSITLDESDGWIARLVAWDVRAQRVAWTRDRGRRLLAAVDGRVILTGGSSAEVLDATTGRTVRTLSSPVSLHGDGRLLLSLDHDRIERFDIRTGERLWSLPVEGLGSRAIVLHLEGDPYALGGGLTRFDPATGGGWHLRANLGRNRTLMNSVGNVIGYTAVLLTGIANGRSQAWRSDVGLLYGLPRRVGAEVFFAADSEAICLDSGTGRTHWRRTIDFDPRERERRRAMGMPVSNARTPGQMLLRPGSADLGVVSTGYAMLNDRWAVSEPPAIALLDRATGRWLRGARLDTTRVVTGYVRLAQGHYLACDGKRVTRLGEDLRTLGSFSMPTGPVSLLGVLAADSALLAITSNELLELDPLTLSPRWRVPLGPGIGRSGARHWYTGDRGLLRWDPVEPGAPRRFFPLRSTASVCRDGVVVSIAGDTATLTWLDEAAEPDLDAD